MKLNEIWKKQEELTAQLEKVAADKESLQKTIIEGVVSDYAAKKKAAKESSLASTAQPQNTLANEFVGEKVIVRTYSAGVFYGFLDKREGLEATITNARQIWGWGDKQLCLMEVSTQGVTPSASKFSTRVAKVLVTEVIEILPITPRALDILDSVKDCTFD